MGTRVLKKFFPPMVVTSVAFYFSGPQTFAANQPVTVMKIIPFESKANKKLDNKITAIADYIFNHMETARQSEEDMWVDSYEVCTFLKISEKTLQRLRVSGTIAYSNIRGRYFYKVSEIRRMLEERLIRSNKENIDNLITNHQLYAKERGNLRKNK